MWKPPAASWGWEEARLAQAAAPPAHAEARTEADQATWSHWQWNRHPLSTRNGSRPRGGIWGTLLLGARFPLVKGSAG